VAAYDPASIAPDWAAQRDALARAYKQGLIGLNSSKNSLFAQQGLLNSADYTTDGKPVDFSSIQVDPNQQYGGYRNELDVEADAMDAADNGPSRGFSGGLANQASAAAKRYAQGRQVQYQQGLQQQLGNFNQQAGNQSFQYGEGLTQIGNNAKEYAANEQAWRLLNAPSQVPGASGGGSTPITPMGSAAPLSANAITSVANRTGLNGLVKPVAKQPTAQVAKNRY
jgi:hypothetical protein